MVLRIFLKVLKMSSFIYWEIQQQPFLGFFVCESDLDLTKILLFYFVVTITHE